MARTIFSPFDFFLLIGLIFVIKATATAERSVTRCADQLRARVKLFDFGDPESESVDRS